jgi:hypothetical protein
MGYRMDKTRIQEVIKKALLQICLLAAFGTANAISIDMLGSQFQGYTIVGTKVIDRWMSEDRREGKSQFDGCNYGRVIIFTDGTYLKCSGYGYQYAYRPTALLLSNGSGFKMIVDDNVYDMRR